MTRIFSFNQNIIPKMKKFAEDKGATFVSETTHRFGDESLKPTEDLIDSKLTYDPKRIVTQIKPKCKVMNNSSISAYNMFMPCSWFCAPQVLYKSDLWKNREAWMIKDTTLDILIKDVLLPWAENIEKIRYLPPSCVKQNAGKNYTYSHAGKKENFNFWWGL